MKIYIMTDLEGISGVQRESETEPENPEYQQACRYLENEVNAAIEGAFEGGATEVLVCDSHGGGFNLCLQHMDTRATFCENNGIKALMAELDESFAGYLNIGHHAKAGTLHAFLDHTQSPDTIFDYTINGISYGEIGQQMLLAGGYAVPQLMISGDKAACEESLDLSPESLTVCVKEAYAREKVICIHPEKANALIKAASKKAVEAVGSIQPFTIAAPYHIQVTFTKTSYADDICRSKPFLTRINARTVQYITDEVANILLPF